MVEIRLEAMKFYAYHGVLEQEKLVGNNFEVDLILSLDLNVEDIQDDLTNTLNYVDVYRLVQREMQVHSDLLEHVAKRIAQSLLSDFELVNSVLVRVSKLHPPFHCELKSVSVQLSLSKTLTN